MSDGFFLQNFFLQKINFEYFQFQDLDMIASIVAKEQALLKMNTAAASSTAEHGRLAGFAIPNRAHTQVIVNGYVSWL